MAAQTAADGGKETMKILFCVSSMHGGGAERVAATLSSAWAARGDEVTLLATYSGRGKCVYDLHPAVKVRWLADEPEMRAGRVIRTLRKPLILRRVLRQEAPQAIVSFLTNVNVSVLRSEERRVGKGRRNGW